MTVDSDSIQSIPPLTIVGAGKLGMAVAEAWQRHGGALGECVTKGQAWSPKGLVFEATSPEAAFDNVKRCIDGRSRGDGFDWMAGTRPLYRGPCRGPRMCCVLQHQLQPRRPCFEPHR